MLRPGQSAVRASALASVITLAFAGVVLSAPTNTDELLNGEQGRLTQSSKRFESGSKAGSTSGIEIVGQDALGGRGFNGDVWTHEGFAYIGNWGFIDWATGNDRFCPAPPNNGVAVVDATDPANPSMVARLENPGGTSAEDVVVYTAASRRRASRCAVPRPAIFPSRAA
jgi:hypothetical protein